jgi:hypothetical protein
MSNMVLPKFAHPDFARPDRKPVGPVAIDWSNPLTKGLKRAYFPQAENPVDSLKILNLVTGNLESTEVISANPTDILDPRMGKSVSINSATSGAVRIPSIGDTGGNGTVFALHRVGSTHNAGPNLIFAHTDFGASHRVYLGYNSTTGYYFRLGGSAAQTGSLATGNVATGQLRSFAISWQSDQTKSKGYVDGRLNATWDRGSIEPGSTASKTHFGYDSSSASASGATGVLLIYDRQLSDAEQKALHDNPYQILKPVNELVYFYAAGSTPTNYTITGAQTVTSSVAAALAFTRNAAIVGALTVSTSIAAATAYNQHPAIVGSVGVSATPAAATEFSSHHVIDGSVSVPVTPEAALDYQRNASITGALTVSASVAAAMAYNQHPAIVGSVGVSATPSAATEFSSGNSISGEVTVSTNIAGVMAFNRNAAIAGDVAVAVTPAASTAYNCHPAIEGALSVGVSVSAGMEYASGASIVGSVSVSAVPSSAIIFNRHASLAGAVPVAVSPAGAMVVNRHPAIDGAASVSMGVAAAMAYAEYVAVTYQDIGLPMLVVNHATRLKAEHYSILETQHISTRLRVH